jgi:hypothetical protein
MPNAIRSPRRVILLGVVISLGFLGFALPRPASKAQEPVKALDKKALRAQIVALHVEIDLLEIEQGIDRQALAESIKEERAIPENLDLFFRRSQTEIKSSSLEVFLSVGGQIWSALREDDKMNDEQLNIALQGDNWWVATGNGGMRFKELAREQFGKDFAEQLARLPKLEKEQFSEARMRLADRAMEEIKKKAPEYFRQIAAPLKKEFTRRSAEIAGKKLDLATLERQYHDAR